MMLTAGEARLPFSKIERGHARLSTRSQLVKCVLTIEWYLGEKIWGTFVNDWSEQHAAGAVVRLFIP
jgi:uncharacterized membrane protein